MLWVECELLSFVFRAGNENDSRFGLELGMIRIRILRGGSDESLSVLRLSTNSTSTFSMYYEREVVIRHK